MAGVDGVSEAPGGVQDGGAGNQQSDSAASQVAQEPSLDQLDPNVRELVAKHAANLAAQETERIRREEQSRRDKMIHEERMRLQRERAEQEQQRALKLMSDEDYGKVMRQRQRQQTELQRQAQSMFEAARSEALQAVEETVQDPQIRQDLETRLQRGEFQTWKDFQRGLIEAAANQRVALMRAELEKAAINNATASVANQPRPDLRNAPPARNVQGRPLSPEQNIAQGFAEAIAKKRRGA
jgi:hypothetical protein